MDGAMVRSEVHAGTRFSTRFQMSGIKSVHTELQPKVLETQGLRWVFVWAVVPKKMRLSSPHPKPNRNPAPYELRHTYVSVNDEMPTGLKKQVVGHSRSMDTEGSL